MTSVDDKPTVSMGEAPVQPHRKELDVVPIQLAAVEDAYHVKLSWRSWVSEHPSNTPDKLLT